MKSTRLAVALSAVNLVLLVVLAVHNLGWARAAEETPILRGRGLQIVDDLGRVRASISVSPAKGDQAETVLLRLITELGRPTVKIAASESASGLSLVGPTGTSDTYIVLEASGKTASMRLRDETGNERLVKPLDFPRRRDESR
jgi:hypothetical protein